MNKINVEKEIVYEGYTRHELLKAFEKVQNEINWKNPISSHIKKEDKDVTEKAIIFFTGSVPVFKKNTNNYLFVKADGYYVAIGS